MPELPEVETIKETLVEHIIGLTITAVTVNHGESVKIPDSIEEFIEKISGKTFRNIRRRGKYLIIELSDKYVMVIHLRMTGQLVFAENNLPIKKHTHLIFHLNNGNELRFIDQRRFGCVWLIPCTEVTLISGLSSLGVEPLSEEFTLSHMKDSLKGRKTKIKPLLLDQRFLAGIGNIYADEVLYRSQIHPERSADSITEEEIEKLYRAIKSVLKEAVKHRGTTFSDYVDGRGEKGSFQNRLIVYQQVGKKCPRCGSVISRIKVGSRSAYFCPGCQQ